MTVSLALTKSVPADRHPAKVYLSRLARGSRRTMKEALDTIAGILTSGVADAQTLDWSALRYQHAQAIRTSLTEMDSPATNRPYSPATINKMLSALRGVLKEAWRLGQMSAEDYHRATDLEAVRGETLPRGRALGAGEVAALLRVCSDDERPAGARDAALLALLYGGGLRRSEAVALDADDYDPESGMLTIHAAKGRKDRTAYATNGTADALADWLAVRGPEPGALFLPVRKDGHIEHLLVRKDGKVERRRMSGQAIMAVVRKRAEQAGVARLSPHDLRRTFVSDLLDAGADITTVSKLAGHASVTTTSRYDRRGEVAKKKAAELLHVPYRARATKPS